MYNQRWHRSMLLICALFLAVGLYVALFTLESTGIDAGKTYREHITVVICADDERMGVESLTEKVNQSSNKLLNRSSTRHHCMSCTLNTSSLPDGRHIVAISPIDKSPRKNRTEFQLTFTSNNTPPQIQLPPESLRVSQGMTLALFVQANEALTQVPGKLFAC